MVDEHPPPPDEAEPGDDEANVPPAMPPPPSTEPRGMSSGSPGRAASVAVGGARIGSGLVLAGGVAVILSLFLPRLTVSGPGGSLSVGTGVGGAGLGLVILAGFAIAKGVEGLRPGSLNMRFGSPILTGVLMAVLLGFQWSDLRRSLDVADAASGVAAEVGAGFWLSVVGAALVLVGGLMLQFRDRLR